MDFKIRAFGACMIGGFPHRYEDSCFHLATEALLETMDRMVRMISDIHALPVVLSPFVFGAQRSNRIARGCVPRLRQIVAAIPGAHYVDVYSVLDQYPRREILLADGTHLSLKGHAVVGECLAPVLAEIVRDQAIKNGKDLAHGRGLVDFER